ncbi:MAG: PcfJ domain-containing protein [Lachnospiraceae bacterium]|nr:PcfJ domain-containing protein [Lachnospiraceae bacterium]
MKEGRKRKEAKDWEYADDTYSILMPTDVREIIREGRELQHCVGNAGYIEWLGFN